MIATLVALARAESQDDEFQKMFDAYPSHPVERVNRAQQDYYKSDEYETYVSWL